MKPKRGRADKADGARSRGGTRETGGKAQLLHLTLGGMDTTLIATGRGNEVKLFLQFFVALHVIHEIADILMLRLLLSARMSMSQRH